MQTKRTFTGERAAGVGTPPLLPQVELMSPPKERNFKIARTEVTSFEFCVSPFDFQSVNGPILLGNTGGWSRPR